MAIDYNATSNRIFVRPDGGVDTSFTLDDILLAQPSYVTKQNNVYYFSAHVILVGDSNARAILSAQLSVLYFTNGTLGNAGGVLNLGTKHIASDGIYYRDGCSVIFDGDNSSYGTDPYNKQITNEDETAKQYPLCAQYGSLFIYSSHFTFINSTVRNDMLDITSNANEVVIADTIIDSNNDHGSATSYTHLFLANMYMEKVTISHFGVLEIGAATFEEWVDVAHYGSAIGLSGFQATPTTPVKLKGLKLRDTAIFGKRPSNSYVELTNLDYTGTKNFQDYGGTYYGVWKLKYTVNAVGLYNGTKIENARNVITNINDDIEFDVLTDVNGSIPEQRVTSEISEYNQSTFNVQLNPFNYRSWYFGKKAVEIPSTINDPLFTSATFLDDPYIDKTPSECDAINIIFDKVQPNQELFNSDFDQSVAVTEDANGALNGVWYVTNSTEVYIDDVTNTFKMRRDGSVPWNSGAIAFQNFDCVSGTTYKLAVKILDMGGATQFRFGFDTYNEYILTSAGTYEFEFTADDNQRRIMINTDPGTYTAFTEWEYFRIYDPNNVTKYQDAVNNEYSYKVDCLANPLSDVYQKLHYMWTLVPTPDDTHYPVSAQTQYGLSVQPGGTKFDGGKRILFENYSGTLVSMTADDGTVYTLPLTVPISIRVIKASDGSPIVGARVFVKEQVSGTELMNDVTNASGIAQINYTYTSDTDIIGRVRKGSNMPFYKTAQIIGTVTSNGFETTTVMVLDE